MWVGELNGTWSAAVPRSANLTHGRFDMHEPTSPNARKLPPPKTWRCIMFAVRCRAWNHPWKTWQSTGRYSTAAKSLTPVPVLENGSIALFREQAFQAKVPALVPRGLFSSLPAIKKWFVGSDDGFGNSSLNEPYLSNYGRAIVPIEITQDGQFNRVEQSLQFFLKYALFISHPRIHVLHLVHSVLVYGS